jgi:hypothetical protein
MTRNSSRYGRYVGILGVLVVVLFVINATLTKQNGVGGIEPGHRLAPFAVPLALGEVNGDANIATHADDGEDGKRPACSVRGAGILNVCELYEQGPVVLALFIDAGSCPRVLSEMQALARVGGHQFSGVRFAGVALEGERGKLRALIRARNLSIPIGFDSDGALAALYKVVSCAQVTFAYPGGVVQSKPLLEIPAPATLRMRVSELAQAARARGYRTRTRLP